MAAVEDAVAEAAEAVVVEVVVEEDAAVVLVATANASEKTMAESHRNRHSRLRRPNRRSEVVALILTILPTFSLFVEKKITTILLFSISSTNHNTQTYTRTNTHVTHTQHCHIEQRVNKHRSRRDQARHEIFFPRQMRARTQRVTLER